MHEEIAEVRRDGETAHNEHDHERVGAQVRRLAQHRQSLGCRLAPALQVAPHRRQHLEGHHPDRQAEDSKNAERRPDPEAVAEHDPGRQTRDGRNRKSGHDHAGRPAAADFREGVADDDENESPADAAERPGNRPCQHQRPIAGRDGA